jgi:ankyrin repeat protein
MQKAVIIASIISVVATQIAWGSSRSSDLAPAPAQQPVAVDSSTPGEVPDRDNLLAMEEQNQQLLAAVDRGDVAEIRVLLKRGADPNAWFYGTTAPAFHPEFRYLTGLEEWPLLTPLVIALDRGNQEIADLLISNGARLLDRNNATLPLFPYLALLEKEMEPLTRTIIERDPSSLTATLNGRSALLLAMATGKTGLVKLMLAKGATWESFAADGRVTPLHAAVMGGDITLVRTLAAKGVYVDRWDQFGRTPLFLAAEMGRDEILGELLKRGADRNFANYVGDTPLMAAIANLQAASVKALLAGGADRNARCSWQSQLAPAGTTLIQLAYLKGNKEALDLLGAKGSVTPLHAAAAKGDTASVRALLAKDAAVDSTDQLGLTPLHYAARAGHPEIAQLLLNKGAEINAQDSYLTTPLFMAAYNGLYEMVELLVARGADVNLAKSNDLTPLMGAVLQKNERIALYLSLKGADVDRRTTEEFAKHNGFATAVEMASSAGLDNLAELLQEPPERRKAELDEGGKIENAEGLNSADTMVNEKEQIDYQERINILQQVLIYNIRNPLAWSLIGKYNMESYKWREAIAAYGKAIYLAPRDCGLLLARAEAFFGAGMVSKGISDLEVCLMIDPENRDALVNLIKRLQLSGQEVPALSYYMRLQKLSPEGQENVGLPSISANNAGEE